MQQVSALNNIALIIIISAIQCTFTTVPHTCSWQPVIDYVNEKYEQYLRDESGLNRRNIEDHRVHCCLYFINPIGHGYVHS